MFPPCWCKLSPISEWLSHYVTHVALATSCLAVSCASFPLLLDIVGTPHGQVHPSALVSPQLSCTEDFQAIFLTFIFPLGPWPEFLAACLVFHSHLKLHVSDGEEFTGCYLFTFLSVNDYHPPGWRHTCFSWPFYPLSDQSLCPIDFLCSHQHDLFTHCQIHLALPHCRPAVLRTERAFLFAYWNALRSSSLTYKVSLHLGSFSPKHFIFPLYSPSKCWFPL